MLGAVAELEAHLAEVISRRGGIGHEDIDPEGLVHDATAGDFLRGHVQRHERVRIVTRRQRRHGRGLGNANVMLAKNEGRGQQRLGIPLSDSRRHDLDLAELLRRGADDDLQRLPLPAGGVQLVRRRHRRCAITRNPQHAVAKRDLHRLRGGQAGEG